VSSVGTNDNPVTRVRSLQVIRDGRVAAALEKYILFIRDLVCQPSEVASRHRPKVRRRDCASPVLMEVNECASGGYEQIAVPQAYLSCCPPGVTPFFSVTPICFYCLGHMVKSRLPLSRRE
jgi:hypothetical protein